MKALFLYSRLTGSSFFIKLLPLIIKRLKHRFDTLDVVESNSIDDLKKYCLLACQEYEYFVFAGGDGTVNMVINFMAEQPKKPILGYIPAGTTNDFAKNFKIKTNIKMALRNIVKGVPAPFDVMKVNDQYVAYVLVCGAFSEISYIAKRSLKKRMGFLAYYLLAMKDVFIPRKINGTLTCNGKTYEVNTPFLLVLNGNHVGGFYVNLKNKISDGKFTIFITRPGVFNGLLHYLFFKVRTTKIVTDHFTFTFANKIEPWCVDGEMATLGNVDAKICPSLFNIIAPKRVAKKLIEQQQIVVEKTNE